MTSSAAAATCSARCGALRDAGAIDLWASCATHAVLPLLATEHGVRLQVETGVAAHRERFGAWSGGFWLPECAYRPGVEDTLASGRRAGVLRRPDAAWPIRSTSSSRSPRAGRSRCRSTGSTISLVWDDRGYPADPVVPRLPRADGQRDARLGERRRALRPRRRRTPARASTPRTSWSRSSLRADAYRAARARPALVVCALDTELLGHWWYEGPVWLDAVIAEAGRRGLALATLPGSARPPRAAQAPTSWRVDLGHRQGPAHLGLSAGRRRRLGGARRPSSSSSRRSARDRPTAARRPRGGPRASCWRCSPATGRSWPRAGWRATTARAGPQPLRSRFGEALSALGASMTDFRADDRRPSPPGLGRAPARARARAGAVAPCSRPSSPAQAGAR